ncbi:MAG: hypothetical protein NXI16_07210 [Alphaproteobacteria bacterium]|nr:hypothetical protein [Alphaproteobacteria bacterium]
MNRPDAIVKVPWSTPVYREFSGPHPMMMSLAGSFPGIRFDFDLPEPGPDDLERAADEQRALTRALTPLAAPDLVARFVESRGLASQAMIRPPHDLVLHHSMPFTFGQSPWCIHIEEIVTLFAPFLWHGKSAGVAARDVPVMPLVRALLESPACRFISSHLSHSADWLGTVFDSEIIRAKSRHIPFGVDFPETPAQAIDAEIARRNAKADDAPVRFLFTNSWSQDPNSLLVRGGLDALLAFAEVLKNRPDWTLTVRSRLPTELLGEDFGGFVKSIPNLSIIDTPISDAEMAALYLDADIYLLPSVGLHTVSILQAMYFGAVLIASDAPAVDEYVTQDVNAAVVPGRENVFSWYGEDGLLNQTFDPLFQGVDQKFTERLFQTMLTLGDDRARQKRLRNTARRFVLDRHGLGPWQSGFEKLLRDALGTGGKGARA